MGIFIKSIETDRLVLRKIGEQDFADFSEYYCDGAVRAAFDFNLGLDVCFSLVLKATGRTIGNVHFVNVAEGYVAEVGYVLHPNYWGQGIMTEALQAIINFAFNDIGLALLRAVTETHSDASINLLKRCGFAHEATIVDFSYGSRVADVCFYTIRNAGGKL